MFTFSRTAFIYLVQSTAALFVRAAFIQGRHFLKKCCVGDIVGKTEKRIHFECFIDSYWLIITSSLAVTLKYTRKSNSKIQKFSNIPNRNESDIY